MAELAISKTGPATVAAGGELTWAMKVTNHGPNDATGVTVTDPLPAGTAFVSADAGCTPAGDVVTCAVGALANGAATTRHVTVKVPVALADTTVLNTATVAGDQGDDDPSNDSASASTTVGPAADLAIVKTGPATVAAGRTVTWTLTASNAGPSTATGVRVSDALPAGVELMSATPSQGSCTGAVECALGTLASGSAAQIQVVARVPAALEGVTLVNRATVAGDQPDPNQGNDGAQAATVVGAPDAGDFDLALVKRVAPGQQPELGHHLRYTLDVTNSGPARATSVKLVDTLPGGADYVSAALPGGKCAEKGGVVTCTLPALASGASARATVTVRPTKAGRLRQHGVRQLRGRRPGPEQRPLERAGRHRRPPGGAADRQASARQGRGGGRPPGPHADPRDQHQHPRRRRGGRVRRPGHVHDLRSRLGSALPVRPAMLDAWGSCRPTRRGP